MERLHVDETTVMPNDDLAREYDFKNIYLKIYPEGEPGNFLILSPRGQVDMSEFQGAEVGEKFTIEIIEMSLLDYEKLPEWDGF